MDFSPRYMFTVAAAPMPLNRETTGTTGKGLMMAVDIYGAMERGGGVRTCSLVGNFLGKSFP